MSEPPAFQLGFADYAAAHPEVGEPTTDEYQISPVYTVQETTTGLLVYQISTNQIGFADFAPAAPGEPSMPEIRDLIMVEAAAREGIPYAMPPDGVTTLDCSLYVLQVYESSGVPFGDGVRTAEQIRQEGIPVGWDDVQPGDLLFFEHTYEPSEPPGPDGRTASHIGISEGAGTQRLWNAVEPCVQLTDISTPYWQQHLFEARAHPALFAIPPEPPNPPLTGAILNALDISNYQSDRSVAELCASVPEPIHRVIVRVPIPDYESVSLQPIALTQIEQARALGLEVQCYMWVYPTAAIPQHAARVDAFLQTSPYYNELLHMWMDVEETMPNHLQPYLREAISDLQSLHWPVGVYTGAYIWPPGWDFSDVPLWIASYGAYTIDTVPLPPCWSSCAMWQWSSTPLDRNRARS